MLHTSHAREFMVGVGDFWEFAQITHGTSIDQMSTIVEVLVENFQCELERLSAVSAFAIRLLMNLDGTSLADMTPVVTDLLLSLRNKTDAEREKIYWELWFTYREKNPQRHCDSSNIELSQGTYSSEHTPVNCTVSPVVENSEIKTLNDTCDKPVITSDTVNQDGNVANDVVYRVISPVVENSETKILN